MSTIDLKLPEDIKAYIEKQALQQGYTDPGGFVAALVEEHQHRQIRAKVESMLLEAVDGPFEEWTDGEMGGILREGEGLLAKLRGTDHSDL